jgi:hypothetical protein
MLWRGAGFSPRGTAAAHEELSLVLEANRVLAEESLKDKEVIREPLAFSAE